MDRITRILQYVSEAAWALRPDVFAALLDVLGVRANGGELTSDEMRERLGVEASGRGIGVTRAGAIAVIPLRGVIVNHADFASEFGGATSMDRFRARFREALGDPNVGTIVLDVDSPGGGVDGVPEAAEEIFRGRSEKRIVAVANTDAASAAYWIASAATEFIASPSSHIGSIGVYTAHVDFSAALEAEGIHVTPWFRRAGSKPNCPSSPH